MTNPISEDKKVVTVLELFAGTCSFSRVASDNGFDIFTSDYDPQFNTDYTVDIMDFEITKVPFKVDVIWASPPCEGFSVASIGHHWNTDHTPKTQKAEMSVKYVEKVRQIIDELRPKYWFIENPRGKLRKLPIMKELPRHTVTYCQYGDTRMKPTDIWTNLKWTPRPVCKNGDTCHIAAPRGSKTGTQGIKTYKDRSRVPKELCQEIVDAIKESL